MKKLFTNLVILFVVLFTFVALQSTAQDAANGVAVKPGTAQQQTGTASANTDRSLKGQYRYLLTKVYNYQAPLVSAFYKNAMDTLKAERAALKQARATVASQTATIKKLNVDVTEKDAIISSSNAKIDEIKLLGIPFTKSTYNLLMWGLVIGFGLALAIVIATTTRAKQEAKYRIKLYDELSEEFQAYKAKANEKEKKLARELQTERNKLDELMGR
ncbi:hypothetical protein DJ568_11475 [Mucilaginibacter hurinus]|uniref:tRNA (Guanine-N1)-methyltransferase n=2 Tax=Mucilaginibacter hurinus TaxID=2201324 RepID=A0A367GLU8_9SPHI|nr:hypothetical protein DJ568_11475 [Mucilaginibacter hurinus]